MIWMLRRLSDPFAAGGAWTLVITSLTWGQPFGARYAGSIAFSVCMFSMSLALFALGFMRRGAPAPLRAGIFAFALPYLLSASVYFPLVCAAGAGKPEFGSSPFLQFFVVSLFFPYIAGKLWVASLLAGMTAWYVSSRAARP